MCALNFLFKIYCYIANKQTELVVLSCGKQYKKKRRK